MTTVTTPPAAPAQRGDPGVPDPAEVEHFAGALFEAGLASIELVDVVLGLRLGLYAALRDAPCTSAELAGRAGVAERYAREWLEQQTAAAVLGIEQDASDGRARRYRLPAAHAHVLLDPDSEAGRAALAESVVVAATWLPLLEPAYRSGSGVRYADFGVHDLQAAFSRPAFVHHLVQRWLPALPDVVARLSAGPARVAEVGCGEGGAALALAQRFPQARIDAVDRDDASVAAARQAAEAAGLSERVRFEVADASVLHRTPATYDLVFCVEVLHDVSDPVGVLRAMRDARAGTGAVLVVDERVGDRLTGPADPLERLLYAFSTLHCLPAGMAQQPSAATGAVMRPAVLRGYAAAAGFTRVEQLPVEHPQLRLHRLHG